MPASYHIDKARGLVVTTASGFLTAAGSLQLVYRQLKAAGTATGSEAPMLAFKDMNTLMGFPAVHAFEQRYGLARVHPVPHRGERPVTGRVHVARPARARAAALRPAVGLSPRAP